MSVKPPACRGEELNEQNYTQSDATIFLELKAHIAQWQGSRKREFFFFLFFIFYFFFFFSQLGTKEMDE